MTEKKKVNPKNHAGNADDLHTVEAYLFKTLHPVTPRADFVTSLREKIIQNPMPKKNTLSPWESAIFIAAGVLSSIIIIVTGVRATLTLIDSLRVLKQSRG